MNKLKVGVAGTGHLGKAHISNYKEIELAEMLIRKKVKILLRNTKPGLLIH